MNIRLLGALALVTALGCESAPSNPGGGGDPDLGGADLTGSGPVFDLSGTPPQGTTSIAGSISASRTLSGDVLVTDTVTIEAGVTLTLAPGTTVRVNSTKMIVVRGTLQANGTKQAPVNIGSVAGSGVGDWTGIGVASGGTTNLVFTALRNATTAFQAAAGSSFDLDAVTIEKSGTGAILNSGGTIRYSALHGVGQGQSSSMLYVNDASPKISDTIIDNGNPGVDLIVVSGATSGPLFDHVEVTGCHCAFHLNNGSKITLSGASIHDNVYGMMVVGSKNTVVTGSNFLLNNVNIGTCTSGTVTSTSNYFIGEIFDASCLGQTATGAQNQPLATAGIRPRP